MAFNKLIYFVAGTLLGATAVVLTKTEKGQKVLSTVVQGAYQASETILESVEILKEDLEDYWAEAKHNYEETVQEECKKEQEEIKLPKKTVTKGKVLEKAVKTTAS